MSFPVVSVSAFWIAMALTRDPKLVICDEPTTALDVTVQKQVIKLLNDLQAKLGFAMFRFARPGAGRRGRPQHHGYVRRPGYRAGAHQGAAHQPDSRVHPRPSGLRPVHRERVRAACTRCPALFTRAISPRAIALRPARAIRASAWTPVRSSSACPAPSTSIPSSPTRCSRQMV